MPASMMSADTGCSAYVVGNSIAIVATGPMPGSTPINVPSSAPISAYSKLTGVSATPKPVARCPNNSTSQPSPGQIGNWSFKPTTNTPTASAATPIAMNSAPDQKSFGLRIGGMFPPDATTAARLDDLQTGQSALAQVA